MKYLSIIVFLHIFFPNALLAQEKTVQKKLIKLGWDYFDANQLIAASDSIQEGLPFDGIVFSINRKTMQAFDTAFLPDSYFKFDKLQKIKWTKFTDNFISVWGFGNAGPYWFDDKIWGNINSNLNNLSKAINKSSAVGIFFDPEYYLSDKPDFNPWIYNNKIYPAESFDEVQQQVKKRGMQTMQALQSSKPDIKVLAVWMLGLVIEQLKYSPLEKTEQALLPAFFEGMLRAKNPGAEIIDGNETAYWYDKASDFLSAKNYLKTKDLALLDSAVSNIYKAVPVAQPVFFDGLLGKTKAFNKRGYDTIQKQNWLTNNLLYAMATSDEYTWLYSERINWFKDSNVVLKLKTATEKMYLQSHDSSNKGFFRNDDLVNESQNKSKNSYSYQVAGNTLILKFYKTPVCFSIYENGNLIDLQESVKVKKINIDLTNKYSGKGNLVVMIAYKENLFNTVTETAIIH